MLQRSRSQKFEHAFLSSKFCGMICVFICNIIINYFFTDVILLINCCLKHRYRLVTLVLFTRSACAVSSRRIHIRLSGLLVRYVGN